MPLKKIGKKTQFDINKNLEILLTLYQGIFLISTWS